jgi:proline iminopeptidase
MRIVSDPSCSQLIVLSIQKTDQTKGLYSTLNQSANMSLSTLSKASTEGYVDVLGRRLYYKSFGKPIKGCVLGLHGGPGLTHDYLLPLSDLAQFGYQVVLYDQLGCGKSEIPKNIALFTVERAIEEVEGVRRRLRLRRIHLYGSSYGGLLAIAYALKYHENVLSLITMGGLANVPFCVSEMQKLKAKLPSDVLRIMEQHEGAGDYGNTEYQEATQEFLKRYFCRLEEWPKDLRHSLEHLNQLIYMTMNGPTEFTIIGGLRYWNVSDQLHKIRVPTLVTCGKYDEVSPKEAKNIHNAIRGSRLVVFHESSHLAIWEERDRYIDVMRKFLDSVPPKTKRLR